MSCCTSCTSSTSFETKLSSGTLPAAQMSIDIWTAPRRSYSTRLELASSSRRETAQPPKCRSTFGTESKSMSTISSLPRETVTVSARVEMSIDICPPRDPARLDLRLAELELRDGQPKCQSTFGLPPGESLALKSFSKRRFFGLTSLTTLVSFVFEYGCH